MTITTENTRRTRQQSLLLLAACLLLSLLYCPPVDTFYDDKEIFSYFGMVISRGGVPYRDFFDHKPPLIFLMNIFGPWGLWLIDTFLVTLASLLFLRTCRQYRLPIPWLLPLLFNLLIRNHLVCEGVGMTRAYTAVFQVISFSVMLSAGRFRYFTMGILAALVFFMQQDQIIPLLPFILYTLFSRSGPSPAAAPGPSPAAHISPARRWLHLLLGSGLVTAIVLLYFGINHALADFWNDAFAFNFSWYPERRSLGDRYRAFKQGLQGTDSEMPLLIALSLGVAALLTRNTQNRRLTITALLNAFLAFSPGYISAKSGTAFYYYYLPFSAAIPLLAFTSFAFQRNNFLADKKCQAFLVFLMGCLPLYNAFQHATHLTLKNRDIVESYPVYKYLRRQPVAINHEDYQLYVFGDNNWVHAYNKFRILAPTHWVYHHFWAWYPSWDADHRQLEGCIEDLIRHRTKYIVYFDPFDWQDPTAKSIWETFLHEHYVQTDIPGVQKLVLWQLRQ
ncbi:MAG: hypothetical protein JST42_13315 [Bacteroidetes bacterium]|nr:hypothetical protein [Bacteroidota bacterium]